VARDRPARDLPGLCPKYLYDTETGPARLTASPQRPQNRQSPPLESVQRERRQQINAAKMAWPPPILDPRPICAAPSLAPSWPSRSAVASRPRLADPADQRPAVAAGAPSRCQQATTASAWGQSARPLTLVIAPGWRYGRRASGPRPYLRVGRQVLRVPSARKRINRPLRHIILAISSGPVASCNP